MSLGMSMWGRRRDTSEFTDIEAKWKAWKLCSCIIMEDHDVRGRTKDEFHFDVVVVVEVQDVTLAANFPLHKHTVTWTRTL